MPYAALHSIVIYISLAQYQLVPANPAETPGVLQSIIAQCNPLYESLTLVLRTCALQLAAQLNCRLALRKPCSDLSGHLEPWRSPRSTKCATQP